MSKFRELFEKALNRYSQPEDIKTEKQLEIERRKKLYDWELEEDKVLLSFDFQGWPIYAEKLKDMLESLGFEDDGEKIFLRHNKENDELLESFPKILTDDGMGYGVHDEYICETQRDVYADNIGDKEVNVFNIFREPFVE